MQDICIPAEAGIQYVLPANLDPRFRGDDVSFAKAIAHFGNAR
jgi:hypothetical protein